MRRNRYFAQKEGLRKRKSEEVCCFGKRKIFLRKEHYIEINPPLVKNTGNISRGSCKSDKQTSAHARVCLQDLQVPREMFPVFFIKGGLIYI